jgi:tetratricopeptide (TPR) repeat protein
VRQISIAACVWVLVSFGGTVAPATAQTSADPAVRAAYETFYRGDKVAADAAFQTLPGRPDDLAGHFGRLLVAHSRLGPDTAPSPEFEQNIDQFIGGASARYDRAKTDEDALFYLAFAYTLRSAYKFQHQKGVVGAARDGAHARGYADVYLKDHPDNGDAHLVRGMYNYFVDLAPSFVHIFRFLLFLPGGDRTNGLKDIEFAAGHGVYFNRLAQLQLVGIYGALEGRTGDAIALGERLSRELPANDEAAFALADVYISPAVERRDEAGRVFEGILDRHKADTAKDGIATRYRATYGLAGARFDAWRCDEGLALLSKVIDAPPADLRWVLPRFLIRRAGYRMLLNDPHAGDDAQRVLGDPAFEKWHDDARDVVKAIRDYRSQGDPALYAALVPANRLVVERRFDEARVRYNELAKGRLDAPQVRYRLAYLDFARGRDGDARPVFAALAGTSAAPDWVRASSWLYVGRIDDLAGQRAAALKAYQRVVDGYSGERAYLAAQVGLITPYRRPAS